MRDIKEPEIRKAEIMDSAFLLFVEKGYINTTTQDIIEKAHISRGLLYYHFKNKEDILYCIVERHSKPLLENLYSLSYDPNKSAIQKIRDFFSITMISPEDITNETIELQNAFNLEQNQYLMDKFSHNLIEKLTEYFSNILEQGKREDVLEVEFPLETSYLLITAYVFASNNTNIKSNGSFQLKSFKLILTRVLKCEGLFE
ncbi:TetR/AcrR family transcriptional regulator [Enterococcus sp. AZ196]|uniref:TetR/AcrR family transcriptional regulator n=1 Tax=Enterococcus sp. AZ196 TaxID=2774659 RepID=UPI003D26F5BC